LSPLQSFAVVTERPLFAQSRQPAKATSGESDAWSSFVLAGIIITPELREVMMLHNDPATLVRVQEGEAIDGWTLASIFPDHVVFRNDVEQHDLMLNLVADGKSPVAPAPKKTSIDRGPTPPALRAFRPS
jgi:type II secretory pathway component PulC